MNRLLVGILLSHTLLAAGENIQTIQAAEIIIKAFNNNPVSGHLTLHLLQIAKNGHSLPEHIKDELKGLGFNFSGKLVNRTLNTRSEAEGLELHYDSGLFRFHYTLTGNNAINSDDLDVNGLPDYLEQMVTVFDYVNNEINVMGYYPPPGDGWVPTGDDNGGSNHYDIYIRNLNHIYYGWVQSEYWANDTGDNENSLVVETNAITSYMVMRNNYDRFPKSEMESIQVTAAHEFYHAIQFGYDAWEQEWLMEATAVWMEEAVYDDINDCYQYMTTWFSSPHISLNSEGGTHWYGSFIYFEYIDEHLGGESSIRRIWESSVNHVSSATVDYSRHAINDGLAPENSSFKDALNKMVIANRIMSSSPNVGIYRYDEADDYPVSAPVTFQTVNYISGNPDTVTSVNLQKFASQYTRIVSTKPVKVELTNLSGPQTDLELHVIMKTSDDDFVVFTGTSITIGQASEYNWIYIAVVSHEATGDDWDYKLVFTDYAPVELTISSIYPNPTKSSVIVILEIPNQETNGLILSIVDILGRTIIKQTVPSVSTDTYQWSWNSRLGNGGLAPTGVYFVIVKMNRLTNTKKFTLLK